METFTVRDLRERTGDLIRGAQEGRLSVVTRHGAPVFIAVPFDEMLIRGGVAIALAVRHFEAGQISLGKAAQLAAVSRADFSRQLASMAVPVIRTSAEELEQELAALGD